MHLGQPDLLCLLRHLHQTEHPLLLPPDLHLQNIYHTLYRYWYFLDPLVYLSILWCHIFLRARYVFLGQVHQDWWAVLQSVCLYAQPHCAQHLYGCCSASITNSMSMEAADKPREEACYCWDFLIGWFVSLQFSYPYHKSSKRPTLYCISILLSPHPVIAP